MVDEQNHIKSISGLGVISPGGFKVYTDAGDGWLNNSGDTVSLKNGGNELIDSKTYSGSIGDDTSIGRDIDGNGTFKNCTNTTQGTTNNGQC